MIFKGVRDGKPYPDHGLSGRDWSQIPPRQIRLDELVTTTTVLALDRLLSEDSTFYGDLFPHVVKWKGVVCVEDGRRRAVRAAVRNRALGELKAATTTRCEYCIEMGARISRDWGLTDEELLALPNYRTASCFSDVDRLVLDYAAAMSRTPVEVSDELFNALREHFDVPQMVELTHVVALENLRARFNLALGIGSAGFSEGMGCAVPG